MNSQAELQMFDRLLELGLSRVAIGRRFVEAGGAAVIQSAQRCERSYRQQQRALVEQAGGCDGGCSAAELVTTRGGDIVCRRTMTPCLRQQLAQDLELWNQVNR